MSHSTGSRAMGLINISITPSFVRRFEKKHTVSRETSRLKRKISTRPCFKPSFLRVLLISVLVFQTMIWNGLSSKLFLAFAIVLVSSLSMINSKSIRSLEKRQIGVLARTGALPQGKRSVEVLARNGELPVPSGGRKESNEERVLDSIIDEIENEENLGKLRIGALVEKLAEQSLGAYYDKRSVAALARNGELPQKRTSDIFSRSGYLVKPLQETVRPQADLFDPDDYLGTAKRTLASARNFLFSNEDFDWKEYRRDQKKNVGASKNFGKRRILDKYLDGQDYFDYEPDGRQWNTLAEVDTPCDKGNSNKRKGNGFFERWEDQSGVPFFQKANRADREDGPTHAGKDITAVEKRFLGRIPQLGRIHQKVQSPSSRRRPHLRPNWL